MEQTTTCDYLIVGAGLAGLHCALRLARKHPRARIILCEAYHYLGGRVVTYHPKKPSLKKLSWENGAGRIHGSHLMVLRYIHKYQIPVMPLSPKQQWLEDKKGAKTEPNNWPGLAQFLYETLSSVDKKVLATHTVAELISEALGVTAARKILAHFPYCSEMFVLRADLALETLAHEMGTNDGFMIAQGGLSQLIQSMVGELEGLDVEFRLGWKLLNVHSIQTVSHATFRVKGEEEYSPAHTKTLTAKKIILALHSEALQSIPPFSRLPALQKLEMCPLLRVYAVFPVRNGKSWFSCMPKTVTDGPLRHIIPIDPAHGVIMISYTDDADTEVWMKVLEKKGVEGLEKAIMKEVRRQFEPLYGSIPDPLFFKAHPWTEGCTYWIPGLYSPEEVSEKIMQPLPHRFPDVFLCGESFSVGKQCWMEGALEHAERLLQKHFGF